MIVALASPRIASSLDDGLERIKQLLAEASGQGAEIVCFPEAYLPGLRAINVEEATGVLARRYAVERYQEEKGQPG